MKCPYCAFSGHRMDLHSHLVSEHPAQVKIYVNQISGKMVYELRCPVCNEMGQKTLRKRAAILAEYEREIRMVAFDLLLFHLDELHSSDESQET